jgi:hypothetical protein
MKCGWMAVTIKRRAENPSAIDFRFAVTFRAREVKTAQVIIGANYRHTPAGEDLTRMKILFSLSLHTFPR